MRRFLTAIGIAFVCVSIAQAGFITSSGAGAFARNNDASVMGNDQQDIASDQVGYTFQVSSSIFVNSLGVWDGPGNGSFPNGDDSSSMIGDGLEQLSTVRLFDGAGGLLASAVVPAGSAPAAGQEFAYASLASAVALNPGTTYTISASYTAGGNAIYNAGSTVPLSNGGTSALTTMAEISIEQNRFGDGTGMPTGSVVGSGGGFIEAYVGPSAQFSAVPEPSSFLFLGLVATSAFAWKRRQNLVALEAE